VIYRFYTPLSLRLYMMAFELLCLRLGRLFEPYVIHVLPMLLVCFGDNSANVREATVNAAKAVMGQLSAQGVKLVLPALMKGLEAGPRKPHGA
jgi:hypothetical protein